MLRRICNSGFLASLAFFTLSCSGGITPVPAAPGLHIQPQIDSEQPIYLNPDLPLDLRVDDLIGRMTLDEKVSQTLYDAKAVERLGIPEYNWWNEALHGVARAGVATVFPQAIGLAATWDTDLMFRVATAISDEARAKHHESLRQGRRGIYEGLTFWSPNINIFRDPRWGRGMETFGEDPYLTGRLAVEFVKGMQGDHPFYLKTIATPKHYAVHSGPEPDRHTFDAVVDERDLRQTYLPAFRTSIVDGGAESVMCAYNRFRGEPCCGSDELLQQILRDEWGFGGYVVSDCWAIMDIYNTHQVVETPPEAAAMGVANGTDLNCGVTYDSLGVAVRTGLLSEEQLDVSLRRLFRARFKLGMFDPPERVPFASIPYSVNDSEEHRALAVETARKSMVLLKNEGGLLPLDRSLGAIAVIGPNADDVGVLLGNYNGIPTDPVTPLEGIRRAVSSSTEVLYAMGAQLAENMPAFRIVSGELLSTLNDGVRMSGLSAELFDNREMEGKPVSSRVDRTVDFGLWNESSLDGIPISDQAVRWTGRLVPSWSGTYRLGGRAQGTYRLFVDDSLLVDFGSQHEANTRWVEVELEAGRGYAVRLEYRPDRAGAGVEFVWARPDTALREEAMLAVEAADAVVMVLGLSPRLEGEEMRVEVPGFEGGDRLDLALPAPQLELMETVVATGKPVVVVLLNGSALAVNWAAENVPALLEAWYPGQAAGTAIADVLFGDYNPAGRLPVTFYRSVDQLPPFSDYDMEGHTYRYFRGDPLFPFGHGLSYTTFAYGDLELPASVQAGVDVRLTVEVENTGSVSGEEVVQFYLTDLEATVPVPIRTLVGIERISLHPGERRQVSFTLTPRQLSIIDDRMERIVEPGIFEISVGGKQPGFIGVSDASTTAVITARFEVGGEPLPIPHSGM